MITNTNGFVSLYSILNDTNTLVVFEDEMNPLVDLFFEDGIENLTITEICGEAGSGKTNLCLYICYKLLLSKEFNGKGTNVLYITGSKSFNYKRFNKIIDNNVFDKNEKIDMENRLHVESCFSNTEFDILMADISSKIEENDIQAIIIDCFSDYCDIEFLDEKNVKDFIQRSIYIKEYLYFKNLRKIALFKKIIFKHKLFLFCTNNVTSKFNNNSDSNFDLNNTFSTNKDEVLLLIKFFSILLLVWGLFGKMLYTQGYF